MSNNVSQGDRMTRLKESMNRASKLMKMETSGTLDKIAQGHRDDINESFDTDVPTHSMMTTVENIGAQATIRQMPANLSSSHLPSEILESFKKNPSPSDKDLYSAFGTEDRGVTKLVEGIMQKKQSNQKNNTRQIVNEALHGNISQQQSISQIDYPMIRTIVEEIVRKYAVSLNKKIISESKTQEVNELNTVMLGKKFKFLDSKGNIYEASLKKIGNINHKKEVVD